MYSIPAVVNKHKTARIASCWFNIYYRLMMHGNSNIQHNKLCFRNSCSVFIAVEKIIINAAIIDLVLFNMKINRQRDSFSCPCHKILYEE